MSHLHLDFAGPPSQAQQPSSIHPASPLGKGGLQQLGREGPQYQALQAAFPIDDPKGLAMLGHGPLPQHLTGGQEGAAKLLHPPCGHPTHQGMAIDAWIQVPAVAMMGPSNHLEVLLSHPGHLQGKLGPSGDPPQALLETLGQKGGVHPQTDHLQSLLLEDLGRQEAVQPPGKQHQGPHRHRQLPSASCRKREGGSISREPRILPRRG